jgi:hypothetical protein
MNIQNLKLEQQVKIQAILFSLMVFFSCSETKFSNESKSYTPDRCRIQMILDSTISEQDKRIGFQCLCEERDTVKRFLFFEDNPWRHIDVPILPKVNPYVTFGNQYETIIKHGFIPFNIENKSYQMIRDKFNITVNEQLENLIPTYLWTQCRYTSYPGEVFLICYILDIRTKPDTFPEVKTNRLHTESQLKVYVANGEITYDLKTKDYACTGALLDSTFKYLFVRTIKHRKNNGITGLEIRDIQQDSLLIKLEMDSSYYVVDPKLFGNYVVYEVFTFRNNNENDGLLPNQIFVFDIFNLKLLKRKYQEGYRFRFQEISNRSLIFMNGDDETTPIEFDTFKIADMELISPLTQISQPY